MAESDSDIRFLAISLMKAPTARDMQTTIGASNLADGCDYCLACNLIGDMRETPVNDRAFLGRVQGTATHGIMQDRMDLARGLVEADLNVADMRRKAQALLYEIGSRYPTAETETHRWIGEIRGYGRFGGTIDLKIPGCIVDWKGSTRKKSLVLQDYMRIAQGLEAYYGRKHKDVKLSEKEYDEAMLDQEYKVTGLYGQQNLYMHADVEAGGDGTHAALVFFNRDGNGWFDNPSEDRYDDPTAVHDVWVMSFDYDRAYALAQIKRGQDIFDHLDAGGKPGDYARHPRCFPCSIDTRMASRAAIAAPVAQAEIVSAAEAIIAGAIDIGVLVPA